MREHLASVRLRITLLATVDAGVAVLLAGAWLVQAVQGSLTDSVRDADRRQLTMVAERIQDGQAPEDATMVLDRATPAGSASYVQIVSNGRVIAASPAARGLQPFDASSTGPAGTATGGEPAGATDPGPSSEKGSALDGPLAVTSVTALGPAGPVELLAASPLGQVERSVDAVRHGLLVTFPLLVAAVGGLTWFLTGRALRPVEGIRREVEAISGSTLARRVPVPASGDEVARLATTMNAMLDRIESAARRQQQFVADASHELRSPVASIRTELEVARLVDDAAEWPATVDRLLGEEARLEAVITDLLVLATLDEGAPLPDATTVDLATEAHEVARRVDGRPDVTIHVEADGPVEVDGNAGQLRRALVNLLDNAIRHAATTVELRVEDHDGGARVVVDDDGPGIAPEDRERVFDRFTRLDGHRARGSADHSSAGHGGAGLGLALVRSIATRHGGQVRADASPSGGARLVLDLPHGDAPGAPQPRHRRLRGTELDDVGAGGGERPARSGRGQGR